MPNNQERRKLAKKLGLLEKRSKLPFSKYMEEISRSQEAGKEIQRRKTEDMLRSLEEQDSAFQEKQRVFEESLKNESQNGNLDSQG